MKAENVRELVPCTKTEVLDLDEMTRDGKRRSEEARRGESDRGCKGQENEKWVKLNEESAARLLHAGHLKVGGGCPVELERKRRLSEATDTKAMANGQGSARDLRENARPIDHLPRTMSCSTFKEVGRNSRKPRHGVMVSISCRSEVMRKPFRDCRFEHERN